MDVDAVGSFDMWHRLRAHQGLTREESIRVLTGLLKGLITPDCAVDYRCEDDRTDSASIAGALSAARNLTSIIAGLTSRSARGHHLS